MGVHPSGLSATAEALGAIPILIGLEIRICFSMYRDRSKTGFVGISHEMRQIRALLHLTAEANRDSSEANTGGENGRVGAVLSQSGS